MVFSSEVLKASCIPKSASGAVFLRSDCLYILLVILFSSDIFMLGHVGRLLGKIYSLGFILEYILYLPEAVLTIAVS